MSCKEKLKQLIGRCDLFCTTEFFRYKEEPQYRTLTGGVCSIALVIFFVSVFANAILVTLNKSEVTGTLLTIEESTEQFSLTATVEGSQKFMFALSVGGQNLNQGERIFDIILYEKQVVNHTQIVNEVTLVPCKVQYWNVSDDIVSIYNRFQFDHHLCPPPGHKFNLQGKFTSEIFKYAEIRIKKCNDSSNPSRRCVNNTTIQNYITKKQKFYINMFFLNTLLNPTRQDGYISYYLEDRNYIPFTMGNFGGLINLFFSQYEVNTDQSILPYVDQKIQSGAQVNNLGQQVASEDVPDEYARFVMRRSSTSVKLLRSFKKVDETLSYIGGLFGFIMTLMVFFKFYTEFSYEIQAGGELYQYENHQDLNAGNFNFLTYLGYVIFIGFKIIGIQLNWETMKRYDDCREEIQKQFDIIFVMERIVFLENAIKMLFEDHQFEGLHLREKLSLKQAEKFRIKYRLKDKINQGCSQTSGEQNKANRQQLNCTENLFNTNQKVNQFQNKSDFSQELEIKNKNNNKSKKNQIYPDFNDQKDGFIGNHNEKKQNIDRVEEKISNNFEEKEEKKESLKKVRHKLKLLHKESLQGNIVSQKIIEEVSPRLMKKVTTSQGQFSSEMPRQSILYKIREEMEEQLRRTNEKNSHLIKSLDQK